MAYIASLLSNDEVAADSIVFGCLVCLLTLCGLAVYQEFHQPGSFNPINFGTAVAAIIGAGGACKTARERWSNPGGLPGRKD